MTITVGFSGIKENTLTMNKKMENLSREVETRKKNQMEILELTYTIQESEPQRSVCSLTCEQGTQGSC